MMKKITNFKDIIDLKKVISLTKVLCKDYFEKLPIFKSKDSAQGKIFKICALIAVIGLTYVSYYIIDFLSQTGQPQIFLRAYLLIMAMIIMFQQIIASTNVYYFSSDLEYILPFPIKPKELLIARFNMLISISYVSIALFLIVPLVMYGLIAATSLLYWVGIIIVIITFPIFFGLIISCLMLFIMQLTKIIKNKDIFQLIVTFILVGILTAFESVAINSVLSNVNEIQQIDQGETINLIEIIDTKIKEVNNYLVTVNPSVEILIGDNIIKNIIELLKIILVNIVAFILFIFVGKKLYLKNILENIQKINTNKIKKKMTNYSYKKNKKEKAYIKNEFRELIKTPAFFMQCVLPIILVVITLTSIVIAMYPSLVAIMQMEEVEEQLAQMPEFKFDINILITILVIIQLIFTFSSLSITAISRKGKKAFFIKYIPIDLYKQFLYLNIPQIFLNIFISLIILGAAKYLIPEISIIYLMAMFVIGLLLNIINSFLMLVIDLRKPNLEWDNETDAIKQNKNKLYQYVLTIIIVLILIYFNKIFVEINFNLAIILILFILIIILLLINKIIKIKINKIFNKII